MLEDLTTRVDARYMMVTRFHRGYRLATDGEISEETIRGMLYALDTEILTQNQGRFPVIQRIEFHSSNLIVVVFDNIVKVYKYNTENNG